MNPGAFTLRELVDMTQARQRDAWNHTASVMALLANVNRDPKKGRPFKPADFHPSPSKKAKRKKGIPLTVDNIKMLKAFVPSA